MTRFFVSALMVLKVAAQPSGSSGSTSECARDGSDYAYSESVSGDTRTITLNFCPNHPYFNMNPNTAIASSTTVTIPANPQFAGEATDSSRASANIDLASAGGDVGLFFNGGMLFSPYPGGTPSTDHSTSATYLEGNTFDPCGGHASQSSSASYHFHVPPACLLNQLGQTDSAHSPQIGWAYDGFPVYGPRGPGGVMMQTCSVTGGTYGTNVCTDDCGGYYSSDNSIDNYKYRYYMQGEHNDGTSCDAPGCPSPTAEYFPNSPNCYRGCCPSGVSCKSVIPACSSSSDGFTSSHSASVPTINGLSVANGLPLNSQACSCDNVACSSSTCSSQSWSKTECRTATNPTCPTTSLAPSPAPSPTPTPPSPATAPAPAPSPTPTVDVDSARMQQSLQVVMAFVVLGVLAQP